MRDLLFTCPECAARSGARPQACLSCRREPHSPPGSEPSWVHSASPMGRKRAPSATLAEMAGGFLASLLFPAFVVWIPPRPLTEETFCKCQGVPTEGG